MSAVSRRPVADEDHDFLAELYASTREAEMALVDWSDAQKNAFLEMQFQAQTSSYAKQFPDALFEVVLVNGEPAGRLAVDHGPDEIHIIDLALLPPYRNRGVGSRLLSEILATGAAAGLPVTLYSRTDNRALKLYRRLGFEAVSDDGVHLLLRADP